MLRRLLPLLLLSACSPADPPLLIDPSNRPAAGESTGHEPQAAPADEEANSR